ncbi:MAG: hypothetical protein HY361_02630 [Candidatus Aenigmarchaeota archaeon]|nr:hypothetical protein [Candidatus Aenigmarchaeota archaeon]
MVDDESEADEKVKAMILHTLARKRKWGKSHTPLINIVKWVVIRKNGKRMKKLISELRKEGLVNIKPTHYGEEISLNFYQKEKVIEVIKKYFNDFIANIIS